MSSVPLVIYCLKELSDRVISWRSPEWVCGHLCTHHIHCQEDEAADDSNVATESKVPYPSRLLVKHWNFVPHSSQLPRYQQWGQASLWGATGRPYFFQLLFFSGLEEVQQCHLGGCSFVMPRCFRTMFWSLVAPTTTETSPEVKLWSKRRLWRNFYLICIPLFHLHTHPAQSASLLATSTCWGKKKEGE